MLGPFAFQWHCFSHKYGYEVLSSFWTISTYLVCRGAWCQSQAKESQRDSEWGWFVKWCQLGAVCTLEIDLREKNTKGCDCWCFFSKNQLITRSWSQPSRPGMSLMKGYDDLGKNVNSTFLWAWAQRICTFWSHHHGSDMSIIISSCVWDP